MIGEIALITPDPKCVEWCSEPNGLRPYASSCDDSEDTFQFLGGPYTLQIRAATQTTHV